MQEPAKKQPEGTVTKLRRYCSFAINEVFDMTKKTLAAVVVATSVALTAPVIGLAEPSQELVELQAQQEQASGPEGPSPLERIKNTVLSITQVAKEKASIRTDERVAEQNLKIKALQDEVARLKREAIERDVMELPDYQSAYECTSLIRDVLRKNAPDFLDRAKAMAEPEVAE